ncbi:hypothetical protein L1049_014126 [Liquidambar formosana]|uniref:Uncharacterized protein n=1 Tax=Liquidambar formosana TaxID=63359 RepID=A0AAP0WXD8_LIQFO
MICHLWLDHLVRQDFGHKNLFPLRHREKFMGLLNGHLYTVLIMSVYVSSSVLQVNSQAVGFQKTTFVKNVKQTCCFIRKCIIAALASEASDGPIISDHLILAYHLLERLLVEQYLHQHISNLAASMHSTIIQRLKSSSHIAGCYFFFLFLLLIIF